MRHMGEMGGWAKNRPRAVCRPLARAQGEERVACGVYGELPVLHHLPPGLAQRLQLREHLVRVRAVADARVAPLGLLGGAPRLTGGADGEGGRDEPGTTTPRRRRRNRSRRRQREVQSVGDAHGRERNDGAAKID